MSCDCGVTCLFIVQKKINIKSEKEKKRKIKLLVFKHPITVPLS